MKDLIRCVRKSPACSHVKILVGGYPFNLVPTLWQTVGADGFGPNAEEALRVAQNLVKGSRS